jgi:hypothetical protein
VISLLTVIRVPSPEDGTRNKQPIRAVPRLGNQEAFEVAASLRDVSNGKMEDT